MTAAASSSESAPATYAAATSPWECPITASGSTPSSCHTAASETIVANSAGCTTSTRSSDGAPDRRGPPRAAIPRGTVKTRRRSSSMRARNAAEGEEASGHPRPLAPLSGEDERHLPSCVSPAGDDPRRRHARRHRRESLRRARSVIRDHHRPVIEPRAGHRQRPADVADRDRRPGCQPGPHLIGLGRHGRRRPSRQHERPGSRRHRGDRRRRRILRALQALQYHVSVGSAETERAYRRPASATRSGSAPPAPGPARAAFPPTGSGARVSQVQVRRNQPCRSASTAFTSPAIPAAASRCPILLFTAPSQSRRAVGPAFRTPPAARPPPPDRRATSRCRGTRRTRPAGLDARRGRSACRSSASCERTFGVVSPVERPS